jgi:3-oxoacyl-[acyl-carrier-protein] synthase-3
MKDSFYSIITGSGRCVPAQVIKNKKFLENEFYNSNGEKMAKTNEEIVSKFQKITEIEERRYVTDGQKASDIAFLAAEKALESNGTNKEELDYIIVAQNFGDIRHDNIKSTYCPSLSAQVKHKLGIVNPYCIAYDITFGCPGWVQAFIQANYYIRSGEAKKILVIGTETLSRISDPHDIDSMIYSDGAGAVIVEAVKSEEPVGILTHLTRSDTLEHVHLLRMGESYNPNYPNDTLFLKMNGRKLYEYALNNVPQLVKDCIDKAGLTIGDIKKVLIHQANAKMDDAILERVFKLYGISEMPKDIMPMTIYKLGNNSVATVPILYDMVAKGEMEGQKLNSGDKIIFTSVGAGMNINAIIYKMP